MYDADLDAFVEALATRIAGFDKWAIANTKRLVNTSLPPEVELGSGWVPERQVVRPRHNIPHRVRYALAQA